MSQINHPSFANNMAPTINDVVNAAEESDAVTSYDLHTDTLIEIEWCDGSTESFAGTVEALNAIRAMSAK